MTYLFNIIISFESKESKENIESKEKIENKENKENKGSEEPKIKINEEEDIGKIDGEFIYKMTFKNFDITKFEYITDDDLTFIEEEKQISGTAEEKKEKKDGKNSKINWKNLKL